MNEDFFPGDFSKKFIGDYLSAQLNFFFPDQISVKEDLNNVLEEAIERFAFSMKHIKIKTHQQFTHLHSDLYAQLLYFISNTAWKREKGLLAQKVYYLNKSLHALNCMYNTELPDVFVFFHIVGTVLGKASYSDFLVVNQGVTVGANKGSSPEIGKGVMLRPGSSVIGQAKIGSLSAISANAFIFNDLIPSGSLVIGSSPDLIVKPLKRYLIKEEIFYGMD